MKINQLLYTHSGRNLSLRGDEKYLPLAKTVCLGGRAAAAAVVHQTLKETGQLEFTDYTGSEEARCQLLESEKNGQHAAYQLSRISQSQEIPLASFAISQYPRPRTVRGHKVRGLIAVTQLFTPQTVAEALEFAGALDTAAQLALSLGIIRLVYDDVPPAAEATSILEEKFQKAKDYAKALEENYDGYVKALEQSLIEWETRYPETAVQEPALPLPADYISRLKKAIQDLSVCIAGGSALWHEKMHQHFPACTFLETKHFEPQKLQGADLLIINTNHTGHALVRKACQQAASQGTLVCYTSRYNINAVAADVLYALGEK